MLKKIIGSFLAAVMIMCQTPCFANVEAAIQRNAVVADPVNKVIILSGNIDIGGDRPIFIKVKDKDEKIVWAETAVSNSNGDFGVTIGTSLLTDGEYKIYASYRTSDETELYTYTGMGDVSASPISAQIKSGDIFMKTETEPDTEFDTVRIKLSNAKTMLGAISADNCEITGFPEGITASAAAEADDTIAITFGGIASEPVLTQYPVTVKLKSGIIVGGSANTDSAVLTGITILPHSEAQKVIFDSTAAGLSMQNYKTPSSETSKLALRYRDLAVDGVLTEGTHFTCTKGSALDGLKLNIAANRASGTLQLSLSGEAKSNVTSDIVITDLVFKPEIAKNALYESDAVTVTIKKSSGTVVPSPGGGGGTAGVSTPSIIRPVTDTEVEPVVPIIPSVINDIERHWAKDYIDKLNKLGFVQGYEDNTYRPDNKITRAEFITLIMRVTGAELKNYSGTFSDVNAGDWFSRNIQAALDMGIISADTNFRPNDYIRRDELVKIAVGAYLTENEAPTMNVSMSTLKDKDEISDWAAEFVQTALNLGLVSGYEDGKFHASNGATRGECAAILARLIDCMSK